MKMKAIVALVLASILLSIGAFALAAGDRYDLSDFEYRDVVTRGRGDLVFQSSPRGSFMKNHKFSDGDEVYVNVNWRSNGYAIAYEDGEYGYVDASYIDWGTGYSGGGRYDLDQYGYRQVVTRGRGSLVFQSSPKGSFMRNYKYTDGDWIYVNLNWRSNGYAIAYEDDGTYGYVDASYIDW